MGLRLLSIQFIITRFNCIRRCSSVIHALVRQYCKQYYLRVNISLCLIDRGKGKLNMRVKCYPASVHRSENVDYL